MSSSIGDLQHLALCIMAEILGIIGVLINTFIVAVNLNDWLKKKALTYVDQIITVLGMTRICAQAASFLHILLETFFHPQNFFLLYYVLKKLDTFFNHGNVWIMTLLSVVFCLKISNFHHVSLLRLKTRLSQKFLHLIAAFSLIAFCYVLLLCLVDFIEFPKYMAQNMTTDGTGTQQKRVLLMVIFVVVNSVPFILYCTSSVLVIASLSVHINRMRLNKTPTSNLDTYYNVIKFMTLTLLYYILNMTTFVTVVHFHMFHSLNIFWVYITVDIFPIIHSVYLIQRTRKLRDRFYKICQLGPNSLWDRQMGNLTLGNPVEIIMK